MIFRLFFLKSWQNILMTKPVSQSVPLLTLLREHGRLITAGGLMTFFSIFGQTILMGIFNNDLQWHFGLSAAELGGLYALGTLGGAAAVMTTGRWLDRFYEPTVLAIMLTGLGLACLLLGVAQVQSLWLLLLAIFMLRWCGQGMMPHIASVCVNRYVPQGRGRAMALIKLGAYAQTAGVPVLIIALKSEIGWQASWLIFGWFVLFVLIPFFWWLLRNHHITRARHEARVQAELLSETPGSVIDKTQMEALLDPRFILICAIITIAPCFTTAIFFFQEAIARAQGISHALFAVSFIFSTLAAIISSVIGGYLIDRIGEPPLLFTMPLIYWLGLVALTIGEGFLPTTLGMSLLGFSIGLVGVLGGPILARLFGTKYLGGVKSTLMGLAIIASAIGPVLSGTILDLGYSVNFLLSCFAAYTAAIWITTLTARNLFTETSVS